MSGLFTFYEPNEQAIKVGELLGSGMFGQVYSGSLTSDGTKVAVKTIKPDLPNTELANAELATEAALTVGAPRLVFRVSLPVLQLLLSPVWPPLLG